MGGRVGFLEPLHRNPNALMAQIVTDVTNLINPPQRTTGGLNQLIGN